MITCTIHRGHNQIGGSCVELLSEKTNILLDLGLPLDSNIFDIPLPEEITSEQGQVLIENSEFIIDCDQVIIAIGQGPNNLIAKTSKLGHSSKNNLIVDENMNTSMEGIYAAGDITSGAATVIKAMGDAKKAAGAIDEYLKNKEKDTTSE